MGNQRRFPIVVCIDEKESLREAYEIQSRCQFPIHLWLRAHATTKVSPEEKKLLGEQLANREAAKTSEFIEPPHKAYSEGATLSQLIDNLFKFHPERISFASRSGKLAGGKILKIVRDQKAFSEDFIIVYKGEWKCGRGSLESVLEGGSILGAAEIEASMVDSGAKWQTTLQSRSEMVLGNSHLPWAPEQAAKTIQEALEAFVANFQSRHKKLVCDVLEYERLGRRDAVQLSQVLRNEIPLSKLTVILSSAGKDIEALYGKPDISAASLRVYYETEHSLLRRAILEGSTKIFADLSGEHSLSESSRLRSYNFAKNVLRSEMLRTYEVYPIICAQGESKPQKNRHPCYCWGVIRLSSGLPALEIGNELDDARSQVKALVHHVASAMHEILSPLELGYKIVHPPEDRLGNWTEAFNKIPPLLKDVPLPKVVKIIQDTLSPRWPEIFWARMYGLVDEINWWPLFVGPPGTGKTFVCAALANTLCGTLVSENSPESERGEPRTRNTKMTPMRPANLFHLMTAAELVSEHPGKTARLIVKWFDDRFKRNDPALPKVGPTLVMIDEIDQLARPRLSDGDISPRESVPPLLTALSDLNLRCHGRVIVAATAQTKDSVDPALQRPGRLDPVIEIPRLTGSEIWAAYSFYLGYVTPRLVEPFVPEFVNTMREEFPIDGRSYSLAEIRKIVLTTQRESLHRGEKVTPDIALEVIKSAHASSPSRSDDHQGKPILLPE